MAQVFSGLKERIERDGPIPVIYSESPFPPDENARIVGVDLDQKYVTFHMEGSDNSADAKWDASCLREICAISAPNGKLTFSAPCLWTITFKE